MMKYYVPVTALGAFLPEQDGLVDKFGGLPWGLPQERWPLCSKCGKPTTLLAQLCHHPVRLNLGKEGRVLFVFQCNHDHSICNFDELEPVPKNTAFILEESELMTGLTEPPAFVEAEAEVRVIEWMEAEEQIAEEDHPKFFDPEEYEEMDIDDITQVEPGPKLGGLPFWWHFAWSVPEGFQFAGQLSDSYQFIYPSFSEVEKYIDIYGRLKIDERGKLRNPDAPPKTNPKNWPHPSVIDSGAVPNVYQDDEGKCYVDIGNFGQGNGYLFVKPDEKNPEVIFFWDR
jgi:hypothetical protein